jgi:hypothetical protein
MRHGDFVESEFGKDDSKNAETNDISRTKPIKGDRLLAELNDSRTRRRWKGRGLGVRTYGKCSP